MKGKFKVLILERGAINAKESNFCGPFCRLVCAGYYILPD